MAGKNLNLLILKYLHEQSDLEHSVNTRDIKQMLAERGLTADTRTIAKEIDHLIELGFDISVSALNGASTAYKLESRMFETAELKMLVDIISASQFVPVEKSRELIAKLSRLTSEHDAQHLRSGIIVGEKTKATRSGLICILDEIDEAIRLRKKISFQMCDYDLNMQKSLRHEGKIYVLSPYATVWEDDRYYLLGHEAERDIIISPRLDHITNPVILDEDMLPPPEDFDVMQYVAAHFNMYRGDIREVTLECENKLIGKLVDKFGTELTPVPVSEDRFQVTLTASVGSTFFGWLLQYTGSIQLIAPQEVRRQYAGYLSKALLEMF